MVEIIVCLTIGIAAGYLLRKKNRLLSVSSRLASVAIYILLFLLGVSLGVNSNVLSQLPKLGGYALALAVLGILGSIIFAALLYCKLFKQSEKEHEE